MPDLETRLLVNGEQLAADGAPLEVENPYTEETIASVGLPSEEQIAAAIAAAREARAHRERGGPQGVVVPVLAIHRRGAPARSLSRAA